MVYITCTYLRHSFILFFIRVTSFITPRQWHQCQLLLATPQRPCLSGTISHQRATAFWSLLSMRSAVLLSPCCTLYRYSCTLLRTVLLAALLSTLLHCAFHCAELRSPPPQQPPLGGWSAPPSVNLRLGGWVVLCVLSCAPPSTSRAKV